MIPITARIDLTLEANLPNSPLDCNQVAITFLHPPHLHASMPSAISSRTGLQKHNQEGLLRAVSEAISDQMNGLSVTIGLRYLSFLQDYHIENNCDHDFRYYVACRETATLQKNDEALICLKCWKVVPLGRKVI